MNQKHKSMASVTESERQGEAQALQETTLSSLVVRKTKSRW